MTRPKAVIAAAVTLALIASVSACGTTIVKEIVTVSPSPSPSITKDTVLGTWEARDGSVLEISRTGSDTCTGHWINSDGSVVKVDLYEVSPTKTISSDVYITMTLTVLSQSLLHAHYQNPSGAMVNRLFYRGLETAAPAAPS
jgi:hypothetical protein